MSYQDTTRTPRRNGHEGRDGGAPGGGGSAAAGTAPVSGQPGASPDGDSYYGRPILKEPTWTWEIPVYFVSGGISGITSGLSFAARLSGNETLARRSQLAALATIAPAPLLLISDLGYPKRFYNMLRMVKLSSPMSLGSWVMTSSSGTTALSTLSLITGRFAWLGWLSGGAAALLGLPLSTYTAVLITNTSVPIWHEARRHMPFLFAFSSAAGAGALSTVLTPHSASGPARRLALIAGAVEVSTSQVMESHLGELAEPLHEGKNGSLAKAAKMLTAGGAVVIATAGRRSPAAARLGAALMLGGVGLTRWTVFKAGFESARDPKYTVEPQRRRRAARAASASV